MEEKKCTQQIKYNLSLSQHYCTNQSHFIVILFSQRYIFQLSYVWQWPTSAIFLCACTCQYVFYIMLNFVGAWTRTFASKFKHSRLALCMANTTINKEWTFIQPFLEHRESVETNEETCPFQCEYEQQQLQLLISPKNWSCLLISKMLNLTKIYGYKCIFYYMSTFSVLAHPNHDTLPCFSHICTICSGL